MHWWPRTIRWQMLSSLLLIEVASITLFALMLVHNQQKDTEERTKERLRSQATQLAVEAGQAILQERPDWVQLSVQLIGASRTVAAARITDTDGNVLFSSLGDTVEMQQLDRQEQAMLPGFEGNGPKVFDFGNHRLEGVHPVVVDSNVRGYAWVTNDYARDSEQITGVLRASLFFGSAWILVSVVLAWLVSRLISRPLTLLHSGTRALMTNPEGSAQFPLPVSSQNEFGDLIDAFNRMVASIAEQRAGLSDTLSLLDSMLANAPVGLAFIDRGLRVVRVNQIFANLTGVQLSRHLGRPVSSIMPPGAGARLEEALQSLFTQQTPSLEMELSGDEPNALHNWTWLVSLYPVLTGPSHVRWAGMIVSDVSERVRAEETLRKTEKLAATGRLAASIAHEINNPLEALINILFLLRSLGGLTPDAIHYLDMADDQVRRVSEIAQQTLRFYRQSTLPARVALTELLDSVLDLYKARLQNLNATVVSEYDPQMTLFCYSGEVRQVFANLFGNAIDAMSTGGKITVRAWASHSWKPPYRRGIRFTIADTGSGMESDVRARIFDAFFTTKEATGTGLGLWVSHEIIAKHFGTVRVCSHPAGQDGRPSGTVFHIFLPDDESLTRVERREQGTGSRE